MARIYSQVLTLYCLFAFLGISHGANFDILGRVYCDPCRIKFETRLSYPLNGVNVSLQCKNIKNDELTFKTQVKTHKDGTYIIKVPREHQDDSCEVFLKKSNNNECSDIMDDQEKDPINLSMNSGIAGNIRFVNDLGYMTKDINPQCVSVIEELAIIPNM